MSKHTSRELTCVSCHTVLEIGTRVDKAPTWSEVRHYDVTVCRALAAVAVVEAPALVEAEQDEPRATFRQVDYADSLQRQYWTPAVFGRARFSTVELGAMTRSAISSVIDALRDESRN